MAAQLRNDRDVAVPMRDGVILRANVLRTDDDQRRAVLVFRTPNEGTQEKTMLLGRSLGRSPAPGVR